MKATPRAILKGILDQSAQRIPVERKQLPQHLPVFFLLTEKGETVEIVGGAAAKEIYGDKTFENTSNFYNHQTVGANIALSAGNQIMVVPVKLPAAKKATVRLSAEVVTATVDGKLKTRIVWHANHYDPDNEDTGTGRGDLNPAYRQGTVAADLTNTKLGEITDPDDQKTYNTPSALYPIFDFEVESKGEYGNRFGFSITAPTEENTFPTDYALSQSLKNFIYRLQLFKKSTASANPSFIYNNHSESFTDFVLEHGVVNKATNIDLSFGEVITEFYSENDDAEKPPTKGPFPRVAIYQDNIEHIAKMIAEGYEVEAMNADGTRKKFKVPGVYSTPTEAKENLYMVNIFTGEDFHGKKYETVDLNSSRMFGGIRFGRDSVIYAQGGTDGFPTTSGAVDKLKLLKTFDETVREWCTNFNDKNPLYDSAKYPFAALWDTGFSMETKKALLLPVGQHKRIWTTLGTHAVADYKTPDLKDEFYVKPALSGAEEISVGMILKSAALLLPESEEFGTPTVRVGIVSRSGHLRDKSSRDRLPLTLELLNMVCKYCGRGNGAWDPKYAFDVNPGNIVELFKDVNVTYQSTAAYNKSWDAGIMWVQNYDTNSCFFPAFRTVYPNDTSVLTSYISMMACCYLERVCEIVWRQLVGNGKLTDDQFIEESNRLIAEEVNGKFDNRFRIEPNTYYTSADKLLGYQWSTDIHFYANNMKTVGSFTIAAKRMSDYAGANATKK